MIIYKTKNVYFRQCKISDAKDYLTFWNDPLVMQYIGDGSWGGGLEKITYFLKKNISEYVKNPKLGFWCIVDKETDKVIGEAGLSRLDNSDEVEAGYLLQRNYWGRGLGTEVLQSLLTYGLEKINLQQIIAVAHPDNKASIKLMEKCGMIYDGEGFYHNRLSVRYIKKKELKISSSK